MTCIRYLCILLLLADAASAVSIGAGPSTLNYDKLVRGGYAEKNVVISTNGVDDLTCFVEFTGETREWMAIEGGGTINLPGNSRKKVIFYIQPPRNQANGKYEGAIYIRASPTTEITSGAGMAVGAGVKILIFAEITGKEDKSVSINEVIVEDTEVGFPIPTAISVINTGNVRLTPSFNIVILDASRQEKFSTDYVGNHILPLKNENIVLNIPSEGLSPGKYLLNVEAFVGNNSVDASEVQFKILESGSKTVAASLESLEISKVVIEVGEMTKVKGIFKNQGERTIQAKLKAEVYTLEGLSEVLEDSDELKVKAGKTVEIVSYFRPSSSGSFIIQGYVLYEGQKTDTKSVPVTVTGWSIMDYFPYILGLLILIALMGAAYWKFTN